MFDSGPELRVAAGDHAAPASGPAPKRRRTRKRKSKRGGGKRRSLIGRLVYWSLVLGLWLAIGGIGTVAWVGAHLPPIQSLEIPKRPPSIQIVDVNGRALARRGDLAGAPLSLKEMPAPPPSSPSRIGASSSITASTPTASRARSWPTFCTAA